MVVYDDSGEIYGVVLRLVALRDLLHTRPCDVEIIIEMLPQWYSDTSSDRRKLRRDLINLEALGYTVGTLPQQRRYISASPHVFTSDDIEALRVVREMIFTGHPRTELVHQLLHKLTHTLPPKQQQQWERPLSLHVPLAPVRDYSACADLIVWLEAAIQRRQQVAFLYRPRGSDVPLRHRRLDPYQIEYTDRQFYLIAYSYQYNIILQFRLDRIVQDAAQDSPQLLASLQHPRRSRPQIRFTYSLPASFAAGGVSERFTIHAVRYEDDRVTIDASDVSEFQIVRILLGYGEHAMLLNGPPSLLQTMRDRVRRMADNYEDHEQ